MAARRDVMEVFWGSACWPGSINICVDLARGKGTTGVDPRDGFGAEQACWPEGGKSVLLDGAVDLCLPLEGTVAGGVTFRPPPLCLGNNCVDTDRGRVFGEVLGWTGAISGPSWSKDLLCLAGSVEGVRVSRPWTDPMSWAAPSLLGDQMPMDRDSRIAAIPQLQSSIPGTGRKFRFMINNWGLVMVGKGVSLGIVQDVVDF